MKNLINKIIKEEIYNLFEDGEENELEWAQDAVDEANEICVL